MQREVTKAIRDALDAHGNLGIEARRVREKDDLFALGLTCLAAVDVMLAIETMLGIVFPAAAMARVNVATIDSIADCVRRTQGHALAA